MEDKIASYNKLFPSIHVIKVVKSKNPKKRFTAYYKIPNGSTAKTSFGDPKATTFFDDNSLTTKRKSYRARASKIKNKQGRYTYKIPGTANSFAYHLLW